MEATVGGRRGHRQRDNLTRVRPKKRRRNKKTTAAAAVADEPSGVDRKDTQFCLRCPKPIQEHGHESRIERTKFIHIFYLREYLNIYNL